MSRCILLKLSNLFFLYLWSRTQSFFKEVRIYIYSYMDPHGFSVLPVERLRPDAEVSCSTEPFQFFFPNKIEQLANEVYRISKPLLSSGNGIRKVVSCKAHYSAILLDSGILLLFCPQSPSLHGQVIDSNGEGVVDVAAGETHIVFCTQSGAVYSFGYSNMYGQLGDGSVWKERAELVSGEEERIPASDGLCGGKVTEEYSLSVQAPADHNLPLLSSSTVMRLPPLSHPRRIPGFGDAPDEDRRALLEGYRAKTGGEVQAKVGSGQAGEGGEDMGLEEREMEGRIPTANTMCPTSCRQIALSAATVPEGEKRFTKGDLSYTVPLPPLSSTPQDDGEKGLVDSPARASSLGPKKDPVRICAVACGTHHTLLLTAKHQAVYACGRGHIGQLGGVRNMPLQASFRCIRLLFGLPIRCITAAGHHSFVVLSTGRLLGFGDNRSGQLGVGHCQQVCTPTAASFLSEVEDPKGHAAHPHAASLPLSSYARHPVGGEPASSKRLKDAKMFSSLRAAYGSYESTYYPMRVQRVNAERASHEPFVLHVWTSESLSIVLTADLTWMSCGLPISRAAASSSRDAATLAGKKGSVKSKRFDGYGALGRPLLSLEESFSFGVMAFSSAIADCVKARGLLSSFLDGNNRDVPRGVAISSALFSLPLAQQRLECFCFPHATVVKIPCARTEGGPPRNKGNRQEEGDRYGSTLFVQSNVVEGCVKFKADPETFSSGIQELGAEGGRREGGARTPAEYSPCSLSLTPLQGNAMRPSTSSPTERDNGIEETHRIAFPRLAFRAAELCPPDHSPANDAFVLRFGGAYTLEKERGKPQASSTKPQPVHDALLFRLPSSTTVIPFPSCCVLI